MTIAPSAEIHPSAVIEEGAEIGPDCKVGPFCLVGAQVKLARGVELKSHVVIAGDTSIGEETRIWPFASIGHQPQDLKFHGEETRLEIGARCMIRESASMNPGTEGGGGLTLIGDDCLFMLGTHVGHDAKVGNRVILANHCSLAGHVIIEDDVILGGLTGVHQFVKIGRGAVVGASTVVVTDVIPYGSAVSTRPELAGLNLVGLKRRGAQKSEINGLRAAFSDIFEGEGTLKERALAAKQKHSDNPLVLEVTAFLLSDSSRSFLLPRAQK